MAVTINQLDEWDDLNFSPAMSAVLSRVQKKLDGKIDALDVKDARRAVSPKTPKSQHLSGNAIDIQVSRYSPAQQRAIVSAFLSDPAIKGVGIIAAAAKEYGTNLAMPGRFGADPAPFAARVFAGCWQRHPASTSA